MVVTVNEETKDAKRTPGRAALISTVVLVLVYVIVGIAAQAVHGASFLTNNSDDVLSATGNLVLGSPFDKFLIIAVLSSAAASSLPPAANCPWPRTEPRPPGSDASTTAT